MKNNEPQKSTHQQSANVHSKKPFFRAGIEHAFFTSKKVQPSPFFQHKTLSQPAVQRMPAFESEMNDKEIAAPVQAKLTIGQPGDKYEQEADRVASQVVDQINAPASAQSTQRQSVQPQEEKEELQAKSTLQSEEAITSGEASPELTSAINSARGGGQPLDASLQSSMGQAMGADFTGVKVHTDTRSDQLNRSIQAKAFTTEQDVFFRQGAYEPGSREGQELIAHELTHVVQQSGGEVRRSLVTPHLHHSLTGITSVSLSKGVIQMKDKKIWNSHSSLQCKINQVIQRLPAFPEGSINKVLYNVVEFPGLNYVNNALLPRNILVGKPDSNVPLQFHKLQIVNDSGKVFVSKDSTETTTTIVDSDFAELQNGTYWVRGVAKSQAGTILYDGFKVEVRNSLPKGGVMIDSAIVGSTYLGSHWTSSAYYNSFAINGILEKGEKQSRFGEGLYITKNTDYGWRAALSKIQEIRQGNVSKFGVFLRPGENLLNPFDGENMKGQFTNPPWSNNEELAHYITEYDVIYDNKEQEIKFNSRAFQKINLVWMGDFDPQTKEPI